VLRKTAGTTDYWVELEGGYVQGQPQCLRNVMMRGLPSLLGRDRSSVDGAGLPTSGAGNVSTAVGDSQEDITCLSVMFTLRV
jgi:hypothetical protein